VKPRRTYGSNKVYSLPGGTEDNDLWVRETFDSEEPELAVIVSVWEPTLEERRAITEGANIELAVWGVQVPVALGTTTEALGKPPAESNGS
jgi:hypothetical protein